MEKKLKIMVVDDEELNRELFSDLFEDDSEVEVISCADGEEALKNLEAFDPDVVLLDIMMPGIDGYEVCKNVRTKNGKQPKVIMLTGMAGDDVEDRSRDSGADKIYFKPINITSLHEEVMGLIA